MGHPADFHGRGRRFDHRQHVEPSQRAGGRKRRGGHGVFDGARFSPGPPRSGPDRCFGAGHADRSGRAVFGHPRHRADRGGRRRDGGPCDRNGRAEFCEERRRQDRTGPVRRGGAGPEPRASAPSARRGGGGADGPLGRAAVRFGQRKFLPASHQFDGGSLFCRRQRRHHHLCERVAGETDRPRQGQDSGLEGP